MGYKDRSKEVYIENATVQISIGERKQSLLDKIIHGKDKTMSIPGQKDCNFFLVSIENWKWVDTEYYGNPRQLRIEPENGYHLVNLPELTFRWYLLVIDNPGVVSEINITISGETMKIKNPRSQIVARFNYQLLTLERVNYSVISQEFPDTVQRYLKKLRQSSHIPLGLPEISIKSFTSERA